MSWQRNDGSTVKLEGHNLHVTKGGKHEIIRWFASITVLGETLHAQGFKKVD